MHSLGVAAILAVTLRICDFIEPCMAQSATWREERDRLEHIGLAGAVGTSQHHQIRLRRHNRPSMIAEIGESQSADAGGVGHELAFCPPPLPCCAGERGCAPPPVISALLVRDGLRRGSAPSASSGLRLSKPKQRPVSWNFLPRGSAQVDLKAGGEGERGIHLRFPCACGQDEGQGDYHTRIGIST
jgi:hypothetical protein